MRIHGKWVHVLSNTDKFISEQLCLHSSQAASHQLGIVFSVSCWASDVSWLTVRHLLRPRRGRDNVCVSAVGGKTPDISSDRRTFADVMTENKLRADKVNIR